MDNHRKKLAAYLIRRHNGDLNKVFVDLFGKNPKRGERFDFKRFLRRNGLVGFAYLSNLLFSLYDFSEQDDNFNYHVNKKGEIE